MPTSSTRKAIEKMADTDPLSTVGLRIRNAVDTIDACLPLGGTQTVSVVAANNAVVAVAFPVGYFSAAPRVVACQRGGNWDWVASVDNVTAAGFNLRVAHFNSSISTFNCQVDWIAVKA